MECTGIHHVGIWVENIEEMISFLTRVMGFRLVTRGPRGSIGPGERAIIHAGGEQFIELLTEPNVRPRPDFPVHPAGHVAGIPHLCLRVTDLPAWQKRLKEQGYDVSDLVPAHGFNRTELGMLRLMFFVSPEGVGFELFEFEEEYRFPGSMHV